MYHIFQNMNKKICSSFAKDPTISTLNFTLLTVYLCHYEFEDSINNGYIDDVNGSRCFKRCKKYLHQQCQWVTRFMGLDTISTKFYSFILYFVVFKE